jgi:hypothetical protein
VDTNYTPVDINPAKANYKVESYSDSTCTWNQEYARMAVRHERRVELAMEGHRWFDLVRWKGVAGTGLKAHMDAYKASESEEVQHHIQEFVAGKHELFPIPQEERQLNPTDMEQNPGY